MCRLHLEPRLWASRGAQSRTRSSTACRVPAGLHPPDPRALLLPLHRVPCPKSYARVFIWLEAAQADPVHSFSDGMALVEKTHIRSSPAPVNPGPSLLLGLDLGIAAVGVSALSARVSAQAPTCRPLVRDPLVAGARTCRYRRAGGGGPDGRARGCLVRQADTLEDRHRGAPRRSRQSPPRSLEMVETIEKTHTRPASLMLWGSGRATPSICWARA